VQEALRAEHGRDRAHQQKRGHGDALPRFHVGPRGSVRGGATQYISQ
jgi:hypothetical protein